MEEKAPIRSAMVSRLPKFGVRSSGPLSNGTPQTTPTTQEVKTTPSVTCTNGVVRASSFSLKWRRDGANAPATSTNPEVGACEDKAQSQPSSTGKEVVKSGAPGTPRLRRSAPSPVAISSPKTIPKQTSKLNPKAGTKLAQSPLNGSLKSAQNGSTTSGLESRLARPRAGSGAHRSSSQDSLSQSSDGLKAQTPDNMVRSHSFTHFKQIPSPTSQPMIRSFSFNRAVELAKPLANTQLRPPRVSFLKPPQLSSGRVGLGLGGLGGGLDGGGGLGLGFQYSRTSPTSTTLSSPLSSTAPTPTTPSALKKPLLPSCVFNKPSGSADAGSLSYRLARPVQARQQKPLFTGRVKGDIRPVTSPGSGGMVDIAVDLESPGENEKADPPSNSDCSSGIGALEDMSLSSASSLERGDTSEEFLDDLESVGDGLSDLDLPDNRKIGSATQSRLRSFLSETMDWANMGLAGHKEDVTVHVSRSPLALSSDGGDFLHGSSLELSPSNSSGGTYMWDEEGLEPLGGPGTHPCDSYDDSELNSMDILNNLDPPGPEELDDDDLMLDVDLPEDGSLHLNTDGMAHLERSERAGRQGHWRRKQHRWNGADHFHNDNRAPVYQQYDGVGVPGSFKGPPRSLPTVGRQDDHSGLLDELTLKHMAQDCGSLKNQLLRLKTLLQLEDTDLPADAAEESEDNTAALQLEELMKEVRVLRDELRSRDKTIAQLTLQCKQLQQQQQPQPEQAGRQGRCQCHHQRAPSSLRPGERQMDRRTHYDKATQTHWRGPSHTGVLAAPLLSPWQAQYQGSPRTSMPQRRQTSNTTAFQHLPHRAPAPGKTSKNSPHRGPQ